MTLFREEINVGFGLVFVFSSFFSFFLSIRTVCFILNTVESLREFPRSKQYFCLSFPLMKIKPAYIFKSSYS